MLRQQDDHRCKIKAGIMFRR